MHNGTQTANSSDPPHQSTLPNGGRFSEIDGLRAVACALVIVAHLSDFILSNRQGGNLTWLYELLLHTFEIGILGVVMFFAISGFVIPNSLRGTRLKGIKLFAIRRFWRLYPPFWIALLLTWIRDKYYMAENLGWDAAMLPSLGIRGQAHIHFWTLEVELVFYFMVAALFLTLGHLGWKILFPVYFILSTLTIAKALDPSATWNPDTMLPGLVIMFWGGICREILRADFSYWQWLKPKWMLGWARSVILGLVSGSTLCVLLLAYDPVRVSGRSYEFAGLIGILGFLFWGVLTPVRIPWLSYVGRWTYSTYLLHFLVIQNAYAVCRKLPFLNFFYNSPLLFTVTVLVGAFLVGAVAYKFIEQPSDQVGKRLTSKRTRMTLPA